MNEYYASLDQVEQAQVPLDTAAGDICSGDAELLGAGPIGVEHYPDLARAAYAWKCPERVKGHDDAVLRAIAEAERLSQEAAAAEAERARRAEAERSAAMSASEFAQIQNGMSVEQVQAIVGSPGQVDFESNTAGVSGVILKWPGESGYGKSYAIVQFVRDLVFAKHGFGL